MKCVVDVVPHELRSRSSARRAAATNAGAELQCPLTLLPSRDARRAPVLSTTQIMGIPGHDPSNSGITSTVAKSRLTGAFEYSSSATPEETGRRSAGPNRGKASGGASSETERVARATL